MRRGWVFLCVCAFAVAACSNKAGIAGPTGSTGTTETTTTIPPTTGTGNTGNPGYFNLGEVKTYTAQIAASFQDTGFRWTYNKSQGDWEANTGGNLVLLGFPWGHVGVVGQRSVGSSMVIPPQQR